MRTRYGTSAWIDQFPRSRVREFPRFEGQRTVDVVVIGGGLTGCATAYACAAAGLRTLLLEGDRIGQGATGRSAGLLLPQPGPAFRDLVAQHGLRAARQAFEIWRRGALDGAALLRRLRVQSHLDGRELLVTAAGAGERALQREQAARRDAGLDAVWLTPAQIRARMHLETAGALKLRDGFALDPYRACAGLAASAVRRGARVFERSVVRQVRFTRRHADVVLERGTIRAGKVVVATGTTGDLFKPLKRHLDSLDTYIVLTAPTPAAVRKQLGDPRVILARAEAPPHVLGWTRDHRLLVAGGDQRETPARTRTAALTQRTGQLMYEALTKYPAILGLQPEYGWDVPYGRSADGLMYIGAHRNYPHHLFALGGWPVDATGAFVAARLLARAARSAPEKGDEVFGWTR